MPSVSQVSRLLRYTLNFGLEKRGFPFMVLRSQNTPMGRVRSAARSQFFAHRPVWQRWPLRISMALLWPVGALLETVRNLRNVPAQGTWAALRHGWQMWSLAMLHNVPPMEFRVYRLAEPSRRHTVGDYLYWPEVELLRTLNALRGARQQDVQDKARFADICQQHALPCIPTLAVFDQGRQILSRPSFTPDQPKLWVKDLRGRQGSGSQQWTRNETGYRDASGRFLEAAALTEHWRQRDCLVQPWLSNHPALAIFSCGPLVTLRIVTGITLAGEVHVITQLMLLSGEEYRGRSRHILCGVEVESGLVIRSVTANGDEVRCHPLTGNTIVGTCIPQWAACLELVRRAHCQAFKDFVFLGWDVAVTPDGPVLIETNAGWGCLYHQVVDGKGLGDSRFASVALEHLEADRCA